MLKARFQQPCLQPHPRYPMPGDSAQTPCVCGMDERDTEGDTSCWQETGIRGGQRCHQLPDAPASETVKQEGQMEPLGGKESGSCQQPEGLNGDTGVPSLGDGSLALVTEPAAPHKSPKPALQLSPTAFSLTADPSQEWKVVKIQRVLIDPTSEPRKAGLSRSASLSEKELKEAKARSQRIAAQLTTAPGPSSKGVLLFNRRKQRVDGLTGAAHGGGQLLSPAPRPPPAAMEESERQGMKPGPDHPSTPREGLQVDTSPCQELPAEAQQVPLSVYLKENMALAATNGVQERATSLMESGVGRFEDAAAPAGSSTTTLVLTQGPKEGKNSEVPGDVPSEVPNAPAGTVTGTAPPASQQQNGAQSRQYYEVHLTLAKPKPVKNRTARPFGTQTSPASGQPAEGPPATELPPPPTYAETLSSPPPLTRVRSPPAYSALYPPWEQKVPPGAPLGYGVSGPNPLPKTGILEESAARRASKKPMFTFVEKPKLGPNPDLLDLVQSADSRKKQKEQGEPNVEDEPFALGAEAANFVPNSVARSGQHLPVADDAPAWSSCLKSPTIKPKPKPQPSHNLTEARGKGAELFARRQSRMEKFIIEGPSQPELLRSPSPTMSLPPSWKYDVNACLSPMVSRHPSKSPSRPFKTPPASLYGGNLMENEVSQKELEISKHQPYQLQSSLFILSPSKRPARSMPQEVPPPRPSLPDAYPYTQQISCPTSPLPPSPVWQPPTMPSAGQTTSEALPLNHSSPANPGAPTEVLLASPCRLLPPRGKAGFQAPRPSYSTRNAGIEPQVWKPSFYYK